MASVVYTKALHLSWTGALNFTSGNVRALLLKGSPSGTPADPDLATVTALLAQATECDFTNYARKTSISGKAANIDNTNNRLELDFDDLTWTSAGGASNNVVGALVLYLFVTNDGDSIPISYHDIGDTTTDGADLTLQPGAEGAIHGASA